MLNGGQKYQHILVGDLIKNGIMHVLPVTARYYHGTYLFYSFSARTFVSHSGMRFFDENTPSKHKDYCRTYKDSCKLMLTELKYKREGEGECRTLYCRVQTLFEEYRGQTEHKYKR